MIINIGRLAGLDENPGILRGPSLAALPVIENAHLSVEDGRIKDYGSMQRLQTGNGQQSAHRCKERHGFTCLVR